MMTTNMTSLALVGVLLIAMTASLPAKTSAFLQQPVSFNNKFKSISDLLRPCVSQPTRSRLPLWMSLLEDEKESQFSGVVELGDTDEEDNVARERVAVQISPPQPAAQQQQPRVVAPFLSQGEVDPSTTNVDFSDPQQTRVILYMILSLLPVLFLIPFMLSREFIPVEYLPPVEL